MDIPRDILSWKYRNEKIGLHLLEVYTPKRQITDCSADYSAEFLGIREIIMMYHMYLETFIINGTSFCFVATLYT